MNELAPLPDHCPGPTSADAGTKSACEGCPNRQVCSSGTVSAPDPDIERIATRLSNVKKKILILSGKGGVGKSTVCAMLARALAEGIEGNVGVLDIDLCGPSIPRLFGLQNEQVHQSGSGWSPIYAEDNLSVMSAGFLLPSPDAAVIWRGPKKNGLIKQLLRDVDWDELEYLLVDCPPGTSDEHLSIVQFLRSAGINGAIIVTTPEEVSLLDVRKEINFCQKVGLPIIGVVENMSGFTCPGCNTTTYDILPIGPGGGAASLGLPILGHVPLDPSLGRACDEGINIFDRTDGGDNVKASSIEAYSLIAAAVANSVA